MTTVYVTHDQVEAMTLGQRVAVMRNGRIQQVDTPQNLYDQPANLFVAAFMGSPSMNLDRGAGRGRPRLPLPASRCRCPAPATCTPSRDEIVIGIRP